MRRWSLCLSALSLVLAPGLAFAQSESSGGSVEGCIGCHSLGEPAPVGNIQDFIDLHYVDTNPKGPATASGYRQWNITVTLADLTTANMVVEFRVADENGADVENVFGTDGRVVLARLDPGPVPGDPTTAGDPTAWIRLLQERFTSSVAFDYLGSGLYRVTTAFDPGSVPILAGQTFRAAIQLSASDIPAGNGWCDFDADLATPNDCVTPTTVTRDIIRTPTCNGCHGVTSDTRLVFHGGRTEVEYCVTCHNPDRNPETGMTTLTHKIHYGAELTQEWLGGDFDHVVFTKEIDNCVNCHESGPADADNWKTKPSIEACGSCHDDIDFAGGTNHIQMTDNRFCSNCHPAEGPRTDSEFPVATVHIGQAISQEGALYRGDGNGFAIEEATFDRQAETITVVFSVTRDGEKMDLLNDPEWTNNSRLNIDLAWSTEDYTNEGSNSDPSPAQPIQYPGRDIPATVEDLGDGRYRRVIDVSEFGFGTATVGLEGYPRALIQGSGAYETIPVRAVYRTVSLEPRQPANARRTIVDIAKCNACHDSGGAGLSLHGNNRTGEIQVCVLCHNPNATDLRRRPADPMTTPDGKREESVDFKRMIHQIHMGGDLTDPVVIYGFGNTPHDYSTVEFIGNNMNCLTCHVPGTYSADKAWQTLPTTVDSGLDVIDPEDDLNISPVTSVCSSCHDTVRAKDHMLANGGTFGSLDSEIATAVPEPESLALSLTALATLQWLARRRRPQ